MTQTNPRVTRKTVVLVKVETTPGTDAVPTALLDALLVEAPDFNANIQLLERGFVHGDLSQVGVRAGRKLASMKFTVEMRGNGRQNTGLIADAPIVGRLLRGCGFSETAIAAGSAQIGAVRRTDTVSGGVAATWVSGGTPSNTDFMDYVLTVVLGGASATAKFRVSEANGYESTLLKNESIVATTTGAGILTVSTVNPLVPTITLTGTWAVGDLIHYDIFGYDGDYTVASAVTNTVATGFAAAISGTLVATLTASAGTNVVTLAFSGATAGITVTSAVTALSLGSSSVTETPTWAGSLVLGQQFKVLVCPTGIQYKPISDAMEYLTCYMYVDGYVHKIFGAEGTFQATANAGDYGKMTFDFTGQYVAPIDAIMPTNGVYESTNPPIFAQAKLRLDSEDITIQNFTYNHMGTVTPREDANSTDGYNGVRITARKPEGGVDPEATFAGNFDFWDRMATSKFMPFSVRFGVTPGNVLWIKAPMAQYTKTTYKDRNGIRVYDAGLQFERESGNDEVIFHYA